MKRLTTLVPMGLLTLMIALPSFGSFAPVKMEVPGNTNFRLELLSPISTQTNKKGDEFECKVLEPRQYAGAIVSGHIAKLKAGGKAGKKSEIALSFDSISMSGDEGKFDAQVQEVYDVENAGKSGKADEEGNVSGKSMKKRAITRSLVGGAVGAVIGGLIGGGKGAAIGSAAGAGIGLTTSLAVDAPDLEFKPGSQFIVLTSERRQR
jgi:hypothetical protein